MGFLRLMLQMLHDLSRLCCHNLRVMESLKTELRAGSGCSGLQRFALMASAELMAKLLSEMLAKIQVDRAQHAFHYCVREQTLNLHRKP